ncbi:MAG: chorismate synthase [Alphaproteobacteria bacterium]|nr:chorismate synthase [Alphaproteobacteria bacterium]
MAGNSFGDLFRFTSWGESHGLAIGVVVDGVPSLIKLSEDDIQPFLDKRKPGNSKHTTQRKEDDIVKIMSGVYQGKTTGTPLSMIIENKDQRSKDYSEIEKTFRPGHADFTYMEKYGIRDPRGGGRSSARETACRVAVGAIANKILKTFLDSNVKIRGAMVQMGEIALIDDKWSWDEVEKNDFFCPSKKTAVEWDKYLKDVRKNGSSVGAVIEIHASGIPAGLGEPVYDKLDADLAKAFMSINAVKGVEIGAGFESAFLTGEQNADEIRTGKVFTSNNAGGILGGISTGQDIVVRFAVKPTSSILTPKKSITKTGKETTISTKGRHDPCVGIRAVPVGEAMMAIVLADHLLRNRGLNNK